MKNETSKMFRLLILLLALTPLAGCDAVELQSKWRTSPITIDGIGTDWPEDTQYFDEDSKVLVSVMNDGDNLYIRLLTRNRATQMMFLRAGFTTWIDDGGGSAKKFGVKFPLPRQTHRPGGVRDHKPRNSMEEILEDSRHNLAILNSPPGDRQVNSIPVTEAAEMGILARMGINEGYLTYELQVPYTLSGDLKIVGIGFETGKIERPSGRGGPGGGRGGPPSWVGGQPGGGGRPSGGRPSGGIPEPFEMWARVHLASN